MAATKKKSNVSELKEPEDTVAEETPHIFTAINAITAELAKEGIAKDRNNQQQKYKFRGIDDVFNALAPLLAKHGVVIAPQYYDRQVTEKQTRNGGVLFYVSIIGSFEFFSSKDASCVSVTTFGEAMDSGDKATNKAMSAAYKYACFQTFCIPTEGEGKDSEEQTHDLAPSQPPAQQQKKAATKKAAPPKQDVKPLTEDEYNDLLNSLVNCDSMEDFEEIKTKLAAAKPRMNTDQAKIFASNFKAKEQELNEETGKKDLENSMDEIKEK